VRKFQTKFVEKITKQISCSITLLAESRAVYEIMWKNIAERGRPQMTVWRMWIACWMPRATNTHSEYVILIPFSLQQWLHERASILRHAYTASLVASMYAYVGPIVFLSQVCMQF
jgi:hypothetical protein